jgi:hypothetical protein
MKTSSQARGKRVPEPSTAPSAIVPTIMKGLTDRGQRPTAT